MKSEYNKEDLHRLGIYFLIVVFGYWMINNVFYFYIIDYKINSFTSEIFFMFLFFWIFITLVLSRTVVSEFQKLEWKFVKEIQILELKIEKLENAV